MTTETSFIDTVEMKHQRVAYFAGQFLDDKDFQTEQQYHLMRRRQLNQELFGHGIRRGFEVPKEINGNEVHVKAGAAVDLNGVELWLEADTTLKFPPQKDGTYFLWMQAREIQDAQKTYSAHAQDQAKVSTWEGSTRTVDAIAFHWSDSAQAVPPGYIKLARIIYANGVLKEIDGGHRQLSATRLAIPGAGFSYHFNDGSRKESGLKFDSGPGRMHISGGETLYLLNKDGVVVSNKWDSTGTLLVQGKTTLEAELSVAKHAEFTASLTVTNQVTVGALVVKGAATLEGELTVKKHAQFDEALTVTNHLKAGSLEIGPGLAHLKGTLTVTGLTTLEGPLQIKNRIDFFGSRFSGGAEAPLVIDADNACVDIKARKQFRISPEQGVVIQRTLDTPGSGVLHVQGQAHLQRGVNVTGARDSKNAFVGDALHVDGPSRLGGLVVHSPGEQIRNGGESRKKVLQQLTKNGDFVFFVDTAGSAGRDKGDLMMFWKSNGVVNGIAIGASGDQRDVQ